MRMSDKAHTS